MPGGLVMYAGFVVSLLLQWLTGLARFFRRGGDRGYLRGVAVADAAQWNASVVVSAAPWFSWVLLMASAFLLLFVNDRWNVRRFVVVTYVVMQRVLERRRRQKNAQVLQACGSE